MASPWSTSEIHMNSLSLSGRLEPREGSRGWRLLLGAFCFSYKSSLLFSQCHGSSPWHGGRPVNSLRLPRDGLLCCASPPFLLPFSVLPSVPCLPCLLYISQWLMESKHLLCASSSLLLVWTCIHCIRTLPNLFSLFPSSLHSAAQMWAKQGNQDTDTKIFVPMYPIVEIHGWGWVSKDAMWILI